MAQLVLKHIDTETAEKLDLRAKRLGTTPEEEASRLLRERLRTEPLPAMATTREERPAIKLQEALVKAKKDVSEYHEIEQPLADPRFVRRHEFLVFTGDVTTEQVPDHRVLRDERIDALLMGIDEGRI